MATVMAGIIYHHCHHTVNFVAHMKSLNLNGHICTLTDMMPTWAFKIFPPHRYNRTRAQEKSRGMSVHSPSVRHPSVYVQRACVQWSVPAPRSLPCSDRDSMKSPDSLVANENFSGYYLLSWWMDVVQVTVKMPRGDWNSPARLRTSEAWALEHWYLYILDGANLFNPGDSVAIGASGGKDTKTIWQQHMRGDSISDVAG